MNKDRNKEENNKKENGNSQYRESCPCREPGPGSPGSSPKSSYQKDKKYLLDRLNRIEGQVRGLKKMVENERYCVEVLDQIAAASAALDSLALVLFENHTRGCVSHAIKSEESEKETIDELMGVIQKFIR